MTRRWYQPLLTGMQVLQGRAIELDAHHAIDLGETLLGLPFFPDMALEQRQRIQDVVARACGGAVSLLVKPCHWK